VKQNGHIGVQHWCWRSMGLFLAVKGPVEFAFVSERYGYSKPLVTVYGWRLFAGRTWRTR
jgi:hypothetical protein